MGNSLVCPSCGMDMHQNQVVKWHQYITYLPLQFAHSYHLDL